MELEITFTQAYGAGLASFVSPCVLPLVPPFLFFLIAVLFDRAKGRWLILGALATTVSFAIGFAIVFSLLAASATPVGQHLTDNFNAIRGEAGALVFLIGLSFFWGPIRGLMGSLRGVLLGAAFAFAWTPCVGPVLARILFAAGNATVFTDVAAHPFIYGLGIGTPFVLIAVIGAIIVARRAPQEDATFYVPRAFGGLLAGSGVMIMHGYLADLAQWMLSVWPSLGTFG